MLLRRIIRFVKYSFWYRLYSIFRRFIPDRYFAFRYTGGWIYLNVRESFNMLQRALGIYERNKKQTLQHYLRPGMTFIDIGVNKGFFTLIAAKTVGQAGKVLAFEPSPDNCDWIRKSIALNNYQNAYVYEMALGHEDMRVSLHLGAKSGHHSLVTHSKNIETDTIEVQMRSLDSILDELQINSIDIIKIDVEGAEQLVLEGAKRTLSSNPNLILLMDLHSHLGVDMTKVYDTLQQVGFSIYEMKPPWDNPIDCSVGLTEWLAKRE